ncbi:hypothetical protein [Kistimonas asteriae]|uniref:hypothetical protein n=1 Tax=Kistimonas asteriae TaxID=517724 RepID=UPI001BA9BFF5|nr:hypothetical protein [Kistimonas asteriae]
MQKDHSELALIRFGGALLVAIVFAIAFSVAHTKYLVFEMVEKGIDPMVAACAIATDLDTSSGRDSCQPYLKNK